MKDLFDIIRFDLQSAIEGFYPKKGDAISGNEALKILDILRPYILKFDKDIDVVKLFCILFTAIRIKKKKASHSFKLFQSAKVNEIQVEKFNKLIRYFSNRETIEPFRTSNDLKSAEFTFKDGQKVKLTGNNTDFFFEFVFRMLDKLNPNSKDWIVEKTPIELDGFLYFQKIFKQKSGSGKRQYKRDLTRREYDEFVLRQLTKDIHNFILKYSTIIPTGKKTTNSELRLIQAFIEVSDYKNDFELSQLRNWIVR